MSRILVFSEQPELLCELLSKARELADGGLADSVAAMGWGDAGLYARYGADLVLLPEPPGDTLPVEPVAGALAREAGELGAALVLIGASKSGREIAARAAARLDAHCVTDISSLSAAPETVTATRMVYGGKAIREDTFSRFPLVVTAASRRFQKREDPREAEVRHIEAYGDQRLRVVERKENQVSDVNVSKADAVVCVGRGFAEKEDLKLAFELAEAIGGAVGCTRPIAGDMQWLPEDRYIGLSGQRVAPKLHISLGCSGQIQHVAGIRDAKLIVAVDKDESAPIWEAADYGIVGDLYEIVPELIKELKK